jgi:hypothetical protein
MVMNTIAQPKITFSEINYKSDKSIDSEDWLEIWNYGNYPEDLSNWVLQGEAFNELYLIPQGTVLPPDGRLVFCRDDVKFKAIHPDVPFLGPFGFRLRGKGQPIRLYDNTNTLFQEVWYRDSLPWPKTPDGHGKTLELLDPFGDIDDGNNWMAFCISGSPGKAPAACSQNLIFTEIYTANLAPWETGDWVEIKNTGTTSMDISRWVFTNRNDSNQFTLPQNTIIQPGERIVFNRRDKFYDYHREARFFGPFEFGIRGHREVLKLYDANGRIYNSMFFHNAYPWPAKPNTEPYSIIIADESQPLCKGLNWLDGCFGGAPGKQCIVSVERNNVADAIHRIYPNPIRESATIEASAHILEINKKLELTVYDFTGSARQVSNTFDGEDIGFTGQGNISLKFKRGDLPAGIYLYRLTQSDTVLATGKMMIVD